MKYKKLIVSGCSYTENIGSWAYVLASEYNLELVNLAYPGAGNKHIVYSLTSYLARNEIDSETTLIGIMWSHPVRDDHIVEINPDFSDQSIYKYEYDHFNRLVRTSEIFSKLNISTLQFQKQFYKENELTPPLNKSGITLDTWTYTELITYYLISKKFTFFQTAFHDYLNGSDLIKNNTNWKLLKEYFYLEELKRINLQQNKTNWVDLTHEQYLGEYAYFSNLLAPDKLHPNQICHKQWTNDILIPKLKEMKIL